MFLKKNYVLILAFHVFAFLLTSAPVLSAAEVIVVKSSSIKPYNDALEGFKSTCKCTVQEINLSETGRGYIRDQITRAKPDAVLAIGMDALTSVAKIDNSPVFYTMVSANGPGFPVDQKNLSGVSMDIPPGPYLHAISELFTGVKRVGLIQTKKNTGKYTKEALTVCSSLGLELIIREISSPGEVPGVVEGLQGKIDLLWMIPDPAVITPQTIDAILLFSFKNKMPVFAFSDKYVKKGALAALSADSFSLGAQTGDLVAKRLGRSYHEKSLRQQPKKMLLSVNGKIAEKFGLTRKSALLQMADEVF